MMETAPAAPRPKINWLDIVWLLFLLGLAVLPPVHEYHKQLTLVAIGIVQLMERRMVAKWPTRGRNYAVLLKILLATMLINHTGDELSINSSYYPIYYLPVVTAAMYYGPWATILWTALASACYSSYLYPALQEYDLTAESAELLALRILFFFMAAMIVNRFAVENRRQTKRYQELAEQLADTNRQLQRAQAEARRSERLAALGQMSAGLAHEIRNPLGVIKGSAEMLQQKLQDSNPLAQELAGYISSEVNRLSALVTRFLTFARPLHAEPTLQAIEPLLDHALQSVAGQWRGGTVIVQKEYEKDLPLLPLDENLFEQAFVNLIQNAYEAMGEQGGTLRLQTTRVEQNGRSGVRVRLQDTGPGIPAEQREQIFNPFFTSKPTGVGLGLSIVSKIIDEHGGVIRVESNGGPGASFVVFFPQVTHRAELDHASISSPNT
ncbi:MAG: DUF4118 domain-containing protein [Acidobacteria bacterium]|jgi:signal transduction histidine kinase|nr:DUF4118 domain-containing protein [Acidobacteriota bacterium]